VTLNAESIPKKINGQASRVLSGEALVVLIEQRELHRLNGVATRVWELCDGRSVHEIAQEIVREFEVELDVALSDVLQFVERLVQLGALEAPAGAA
jgi:pyrroloquinoline quinone biosynthesis protein D